MLHYNELIMSVYDALRGASIRVQNFAQARYTGDIREIYGRYAGVIGLRGASIRVQNFAQVRARVRAKARVRDRGLRLP